MLLLALLLAVGLPQGEPRTNISVSGKQGLLSCHVCEQENGFQCRGSVQCTSKEKMCATAAIRIFPRFYYVSKQCAQYCPIIRQPPGEKPYIMEKPLPFLYAMCCSSHLCNQDGPRINDTTFREFYGRAEGRSRRRAWLPLLLALASVWLGLRLL